MHRIDYTNLCFQGGGAAGVAYVGAIKKLESLESEGKFSFAEVKRVAGASVGAITALLVALGYKADEIYEKIGNINFHSLEDNSFGVISGGIREITEYGFYNSDKLLAFIQQCIKTKTGNVNATFADFSKLGFKDLYVVTTKVVMRDSDGANEIKVFSIENAANTMVAPIVLASASIPFVFPRVLLDEVNPGCYRYVKSSATAHSYVDGGTEDNCPIELFDHWRYISKEDRKEVETRLIPPAETKIEIFKNPKTLGFRLLNQAAITDVKEHMPTITPMPSSQPITYLAALVNGLSDAPQTARFKLLHDETRTVFIDRLGVSATATIDSVTSHKLIASGDVGVSQFYGVTPTPATTVALFAAKRVRTGRIHDPAVVKVVTPVTSRRSETCCVIL